MTNANMPAVLEFLTRVLNTPSPTGYHTEAIQLVCDAISALNLPDLTIASTNKGALVVTLQGVKSDAPRAVSGHIDTLGAMVRQVKDNGRLLLTQLGSYAWQAAEGENVTIITADGLKRFRGSIQTITPSVHTSRNAREGKREDDRIEVRLDERVATKDETLALGIEVGDFCCFDPRVEITETGFIKSRHLDDKAGVAAQFGALLALAETEQRPAQRTTFFFSNYEEVGHGAAAGIPGDVQELLVIDMAASTTGEHQNSDEYTVGICAKDSSGPYDLAMRNKLVSLCLTNDIPFQIDTYPFYGSDGSAYLRAGGDVRVGLIGPGVDASHAYERTHGDSLEATVELTIAYLLAP